MEGVSISEAAHRLGVSSDTIRRRIRRGQLQAQQERIPQGYIWRVELPVEVQSTSRSGRFGGYGPEASRGEMQALQELVQVLRGELEARRREVQELHVLLQQAYPLPSGKGKSLEGHRFSWWRRVVGRIRGA